MAYGADFEKYYREAQEAGVRFIRYNVDKPPKVQGSKKAEKVVVHHELFGKKVALHCDLVILTTPLIPNRDNEEISKMLKVPLSEEGFFLDKPLMPGAKEYFQKLINDDRFDVIILTQPPRRADHSIREKRIWLQERFPNFDHTNIIFGHRKSLVRGDLLFDDCPDHLLSWKKVNPKGTVVTITYPYNEDIKVDKRFDRKNAWEEFYHFVNSLK